MVDDELGSWPCALGSRDDADGPQGRLVVMTEGLGRGLVGHRGQRSSDGAYCLSQMHSSEFSDIAPCYALWTTVLLVPRSRWRIIHI